MQGAASTAQRLLDRAEAAGASGTPAWHQARGWGAWARWDFVAMRDAMQRAEAGYRAAGQAVRALQGLAYRSAALVVVGQAGQVPPALLEADREARQAMSLETRMMVLLARQWHALELGRLHELGPLLDEMMDALEASDDASLWYRAFTIARLNGLPGTSRALDRYADGVMRVSAGQASPLRAMALAQRALRALWQGRPELAQAALDAADDDARWLGHPPNVAAALNPRRSQTRLLITLSSLTPTNGQRQIGLPAHI